MGYKIYYKDKCSKGGRFEQWDGKVYPSFFQANKEIVKSDDRLMKDKQMLKQCGTPYWDVRKIPDKDKVRTKLMRIGGGEFKIPTYQDLMKW